jgi:hypothetical protein
LIALAIGLVEAIKLMIRKAVGDKDKELVRALHDDLHRLGERVARIEGRLNGKLERQ